MSTGLKLYQVAAEYQEAAEKLSSMDLDEVTIADTLESISGDLEVKATNVAFVIRNLESLADQIKLAEKTMADRRKAIENRAESLNRYLQYNMECCGITQINHPMFSLKIKKNPELVVVDNEADIPESYWKQPPLPPKQLDKMAIKKDIKDGFNVPGAHLDSKTRLTIG